MMQEFVDQINKSARSATEDMHTALPGEIKSYDPEGSWSCTARLLEVKQE